MALVLNGSTGITYPAGGTDNVAGAGVGTTDTQTLSNKTISGNLNMTGGSKYQVSGVTTNALAWVNFNGTTASPSTIRSAYNVGSVTKTGTGTYVLNFTNALSDANYSIIGSVGPASAGGEAVQITSYTTTTATIATSNNLTGLLDRANVCIAIFGN